MDEIRELALQQGIHIEDDNMIDVNSFQYVSLMIDIEEKYGIIMPDAVFSEGVMSIEQLAELVVSLEKAKRENK